MFLSCECHSLNCDAPDAEIKHCTCLVISRILWYLRKEEANTFGVFKAAIQYLPIEKIFRASFLEDNQKHGMEKLWNNSLIQCSGTH